MHALRESITVKYHACTLKLGLPRVDSVVRIFLSSGEKIGSSDLKILTCTDLQSHLGVQVYEGPFRDEYSLRIQLD
ncbi:hypothetical protein Tco_0668877 [Tanacetum coccineum]